MKALLSILTLYNSDNAIFDNFHLPEGIAKEDVTNNLLMELAELELIYASPELMKAAIGFWSKKELSVWEKLYATTTIEYNPIWNQFRTEEFSDKQIRNLGVSDKEIRNLSGTDNEIRELSGTDNETRDLTGTGTHHSETDGTTTNNGSDISKESVSGFNENTPTLAKQTEQILGAGNTVAGSVDTTDGSTDSGTVNKTLTDSGTVNRALTDTGTVDKATTETGTVENIHTATFEGHTGILSVQQLLNMERETVQFNVINHIIDSFKGRFCVLIY